MSTRSDNVVRVEGYGPDDVIAPREIHHVTFKTNRLDEMIEFYATLTGHQPTFHGKRFGAASFDVANHRIALLQPAPWQELAPEQAALSVGLHHVGYEYDTLDGLLHTYARVKRRGIEPEWAVNHGPTLSFYYRDPDGNEIEMQVDTFPDSAATNDFMRSEAFARNPIGVLVVPEDLIARRAAGEPDSALLRRADT